MISEKDVQQVAKLSRVHLSPEEVQTFTKELEGILEYITQLNKLNTDKVEPTSHALPLANVHREDIVRPSLPQEKSLAISVEKQKGAFKVPKVIE